MGHWIFSCLDLEFARFFSDLRQLASVIYPMHCMCMSLLYFRHFCLEESLTWTEEIWWHFKLHDILLTKFSVYPSLLCLRLFMLLPEAHSLVSILTLPDMYFSLPTSSTFMYTHTLRLNMKLYFGSLKNSHEDDCVVNLVQCLGYSLFFTSNHVVVCDTKPSSRTVSTLQNSVWPLLLAYCLSKDSFFFCCHFLKT